MSENENKRRLLSIGNKVKLAREEMNLTQEQFADKYGYARTTLAKLEAGIRDFKSTEIITLAKQLNVSSDYLLGLSEGKTHKLDDMQKATGLSVEACESLEKWNETKFMYVKLLKSISFLIEHGHKFLEKLYEFLFYHYYFADSKYAATFKLPENAELYQNFMLVYSSKEIQEGRILVEPDKLNYMHFGEAIHELSELKNIAEEILDKGGENNGKHNETNE